ncbi:MAG: response regulator transcription factor, partial [Bdellovibrionales bacterium]|nr:response regulator transcription factor [Bdellovibrionales bacterium]
FGGIQVVATDDGSHAEELLEDECRSVDLLVIDYDLAPALRENLVTALARSGRRPAILFVAENENDVEPCTWTASESIERPFSPGEFVARAKSLVI